MKNKLLITNFIFSAAFILLIAADQFTKKLANVYLAQGDIDIIPNVLKLHYLTNRGAAWGMFEGAQFLFIGITIVVIIGMIYYYVRIPFEKKYLLLRFSLILLAAGAVGNFIDRVRYQYVVDFIYVECINFPVFNVADCFVCISAVLLIYCLLFRHKNEDFTWKKKS